MSDELHDEIAEMFDGLQERSIEAGGEPHLGYEDGIAWDNIAEPTTPAAKATKPLRNQRYYHRHREAIKQKRRERYRRNKNQ